MVISLSDRAVILSAVGLIVFVLEKRLLKQETVRDFVLYCTKSFVLPEARRNRTPHFNAATGCDFRL